MPHQPLLEVWEMKFFKVHVQKLMQSCLPEPLFLSLCSKAFELFKLSWTKLYESKHQNFVRMPVGCILHGVQTLTD